MDFIEKFKLNLEWDENEELNLVDRKAQIRVKLQIVTVPTDIQRVHYLSSEASGAESPRVQSPKSVDNEAVAFQVSCMKRLDDIHTPENKPKSKLSIEEQLQLHEKKYSDLIRKYPQLLEINFVKGTPAHGVFHRIDVDPTMPPCKSKRRPLILNKAKAEEGRRTWLQMEKDGIIEKVKPGSRTDYTSALHLVDKPGGGVRPCSDFRLLNLRTITDAYPLPLLRDFTSRIHGAKLLFF